jgi:hypothetical protein
MPEAPDAIATFKLAQARPLASQPQPWRSGAPALAAINPVPSMINEDESRFLHWVARHWVSGMGHIVDMGPLAGGSTYALCSGLSLNPAARGRTRVHSYDNWRFFPDWQRFFPGTALNAGDDLRPLFERNVRPFAGLVSAHAGDLRAQQWNGEAIELLFIDAAKEPSVWWHIVREFLPSCIPGRTLVIHQDWVCAECPWIHLTMARLSEYFAVIDSPDGGSVAFLLERAVPPGLLDAEDLLALPAATVADRFGRARSWTLGWYALDVRLAEAHHWAMRGEPEAAKRLVDEVLAHPDYGPEVRYDVDMVLDALRRLREESSPWRRLRRMIRNSGRPSA